MKPLVLLLSTLLLFLAGAPDSASAQDLGNHATSLSVSNELAPEVAADHSDSIEYAHGLRRRGAWLMSTALGLSIVATASVGAVYVLGMTGTWNLGAAGLLFTVGIATGATALALFIWGRVARSRGNALLRESENDLAFGLAPAEGGGVAVLGGRF